MNSKGVSPMIAVVLLIAFTVAVGGIMSVWLGGYASTTQEAVENSSTDQTKCAGTYIDIISVDTSVIMITNRGSETISSITCHAGNGTSWGLGSVTAGGINRTSWNETGTGGSYETGFGTVITCAGSCRSIGVTGECRLGQGCWKV